MSRLFLTILEGENPNEAQPILATEDPEIIRTVARHLMLRLRLDDESRQPIEKKLANLLRFPEEEPEEPGDQEEQEEQEEGEDGNE